MFVARFPSYAGTGALGEPRARDYSRLDGQTQAYL